jgi:hypothetical protein
MRMDRNIYIFYASVTWPPSFPVLIPLGFFLQRVCKEHFCREKMQNVNEVSDRTVRIAECAADEMPARKWISS